MMKKCFGLITLILFSVGCSKKPEVEVGTQSKVSHAIKVLNFSSRSAFDYAFNSPTPPRPVKTFSDAVDEGEYFEIVNLRSSETHCVSLEELVPDKTLSKMLNQEGEIIVADTLYKITPNGTFFSHLSQKQDLYDYANQYSQVKQNEELCGEDLYKYKTAYRHDSYKNFDFSEVPNEEAPLRASTYSDTPYLQDIDVSDFAYRNPQAVNVFSKLWASAGGRISNILKLSSSRRLNCEVFSVNNFFVKTVGITAKVQKKMWYGGWAKLKYIAPHKLRIGFRNVLLSTGIRLSNPHLPAPMVITSESVNDIYQRGIDIVYGKKQSNGQMEYSLIPNAPLRAHGFSGGNIDKVSYYPWTAIFGTSSVYDFHPSFWGYNQEDESEITFRFSHVLKTIVVSVNNLSPYLLKPNDPINMSWEGIKQLISMISVESEDSPVKRTLLRGRFYVAYDYENRWHGMEMYWE